MNELIDYFVKMGFDPETAVGLATRVGKMAPPEPPIANGIKVDPTGAIHTLLTTRYGMEPAVAAGVAGKILGQDTLEAGPARVTEDTLEPGQASVHEDTLEPGVATVATAAKPPRVDAISGNDQRIPHRWYSKPTKADYDRADQLLYKLHPRSKAGVDAITSADSPTPPPPAPRLRILSGSDVSPWTTTHSAGENK